VEEIKEDKETLEERGGGRRETGTGNGGRRNADKRIRKKKRK